MTGTSESRVSRGPIGVASALALLVVPLVVGLGLYARFRGLGERPLAFDEYYFVRSVENLLAHGFPAFDTGGYYVRGLLVQYLTAGSVQLFGEGGFALRLPAALFSLVASALAYVYARLFVGRPLAAVVAGILLLSSWQIEFARFARMYTAFQAATLLYLITLHWAYFEDRWERRYWPHLALLLCISTHSLSVLLAPALFLPLLLARGRARLDDAGKRIRFALAGLALSLLAAAPVLVKFRYLGVQQHLPEGFQWAASSQVLRGVSPLWHASGHSGAQALALALVALLLGGALWTWKSGAWLSARFREPRLWILVGMLVTAGLHQFALCGLLFLLGALRFDLLKVRTLSPAEWSLLAGSALLGAVWIGVVGLRPEALEEVAAGDRARALRLLFFGFPDLFSPVVAIWRDELPGVGALAALGIGAELWRIRKAPLEEVLAQPAIWLVYVALCFGVLYSQGPTTRYAFFVFPLVWTTLAIALESLCNRLPAPGRRTLGAPVLAAAALTLLFLWSDDFQTRHLLAVDSPDVRWRQGEFRPYEAVWFWRYDFESPARFAQEVANREPDARVLVVNQPPVSYYLQRQHAVYVPRGVGRFAAVSREHGSVDLWSNERLLSTFDEVRDYTRCTKRVFLVRHAQPDKAGYPFFKDPQIAGFDEREVWGERLVHSEPVFVARDGRLAVISIELRLPSATSGQGDAACADPTRFATGTPAWSLR